MVYTRLIQFSAFHFLQRKFVVLLEGQAEMAVETKPEDRRKIHLASQSTYIPQSLSNYIPARGALISNEYNYNINKACNFQASRTFQY